MPQHTARRSAKRIFCLAYAAVDINCGNYSLKCVRHNRRSCSAARHLLTLTEQEPVAEVYFLGILKSDFSHTAYERRRVSSPSGKFLWCEKRYSAVIKPRTESPKNSSRSLSPVVRCFSFAYDECVTALSKSDIFLNLYCIFPVIR